MAETQSRPATPEDAQVVMKLYDLRREPEMRKARKFITFEWWPTNAEDVRKVMFAFGSAENTYYRQALSYWEMAAALVNRGAVQSDLFDDWNSEMYFVFAKLKPYLAEIRAQFPDAFSQREAATLRNENAKKKAATIEARFKAVQEMRAQAAKA